LDIQFTSVPHEGVPLWAGNSFVCISGSRSAMPVLYRFDRTGTRLPDVSVSLPGIDILSLGGVADAPDGRLAVHGRGFDRQLNRSTSFLGLIANDGQQQIAVRLFPYWVAEMAFAPDGVLWTAGGETDGVEVLNTNHAVIRRWNASGKLIGSLAPRYEIRAPRPRGHQATQSWFAVGGDRVGWYCAISELYIEYSLDGKQMGRYKGADVPPEAHYNGLGMTGDGDVFLSVDYPSKNAPLGRASDIFMLDRVRNCWSAVAKKEPVAGGPHWIMGAQGPHLIVYVRQNKVRLLRLAEPRDAASKTMPKIKP
jgi:hypothetical protein